MAAGTAERVSLPIIHLRSPSWIDRATLYAAVAVGTAAPAALGMKMVPMKNVASFAHDTATPPRNTHSLTRTYYTRRK